MGWNPFIPSHCSNTYPATEVKINPSKTPRSYPFDIQGGVTRRVKLFSALSVSGRTSTSWRKLASPKFSSTPTAWGSMGLSSWRTRRRGSPMPRRKWFWVRGLSSLHIYCYCLVRVFSEVSNEHWSTFVFPDVSPYFIIIKGIVNGKHTWSSIIIVKVCPIPLHAKQSASNISLLFLLYNK